MFLEQVRLLNFRRYYGDHKIDFNFSDEKNVTIFSADNNSGKSSFVNALTWGLYGFELHDPKEKSEPLCNKIILKEAEEKENNPQAKVEVFIRFYNLDELGNKEYFEITRSLTFQKWGDAEWTPETSDRVIFEDNLGRISEDEVAEYKIQEIIPEDMFQYFFFNGASMGNYFDYNSEFNLKESIDNISQLELITAVYNQLKGTSSKLEVDRKKNTPQNSAELMDEIVKTKSELNNAKDDKDRLKKDQENAHRKKIEYKQKLKKNKAKEVKKLMDDRSKYETLKKTTRNEIQKSKAKYENLILELFPICALFDPIYNSYVTMQNSIEKDAIPEDVRQQLLEYIKDKGRCICGADLEDHPECIDEIAQGLKTEDEVNSLYREESKSIKKILKKLKKIPEIDKLSSEISSKQEYLDLINSKLNKISDDLLNANEEKVKEYERFYKQFDEEYERLSKELENIIVRIDNLKNKLSKLEKKYQEINHLNEKLDKIKRKIDFCDSLIEVVSDLKKGVRDHIRRKVNCRTKDQFIGIKYDEYSDVIMDEQYNVTIIENDGSEVKPSDLSDGIENILALSFIMALHSVNGFDFPLIIDAPFEKLDTKQRLNFIQNLHSFTKNKQVVFLFTDSQYTPEVRANMKNIILDEYELIKKENKKTIIKPFGK